MRVFLGPVEVAGYYRNLSKGMESLGVDCEYITFHTHPFDYGEKESELGIVALIRWLSDHGAKNSATILTPRLLLSVLSEIFKCLYFLKCLFRYDVFIFGYGYSLLLGNIDLPILRMFGKRVIMNLAHGSEMRPPYINGAHSSADGSMGISPEALAGLAASCRRKGRFFEKHTDIVIGAPYSTTQFFSKNMINSFALGLPFHDGHPVAHSSNSVSSESSIDTLASPVRILHSPSRMAAKGSAHIRDAIERLRARGYDIEFIELHGCTNLEVIEQIQHCDFVVDQIYSDSPMAGFALEAAWFGKPAVVGGYCLENLKNHVLPAMYPPSHICHPDKVEAAIEQLVVEPDLRERLGLEAHSFVRAQWPAESVAKRFMRLVGGDVPEDWWLDPNDVFYFYGWGLSEDNARMNIRNMVDSCGVQSLQLFHRPQLEHAFLQFAELKPG